MRKADLVEGEHYYVARGTSHKYGEDHVLLVKNEEHVGVSMSSVGLSALIEAGVGAKLVAAHRAYAEVEAYPDDFTANERQARKNAVNTAWNEARVAYVEADELRVFRPGKYSTSCNLSGVLVRSVGKDGTLGRYNTRPRRDFRSTWAQHEYTMEQDAKWRAEQAVKQAEAEKKRKAQHAIVGDLLREAFGDDYYFPNYKRDVELTFDQFLELAEAFKHISLETNLDVTYHGRL